MGATQALPSARSQAKAPRGRGSPKPVPAVIDLEAHAGALPGGASLGGGITLPPLPSSQTPVGTPAQQFAALQEQIALLQAQAHAVLQQQPPRSSPVARSGGLSGGSHPSPSMAAPPVPPNPNSWHLGSMACFGAEEDTPNSPGAEEDIVDVLQHLEPPPGAKHAIRRLRRLILTAGALTDTRRAEHRFILFLHSIQPPTTTEVEPPAHGPQVIYVPDPKDSAAKLPALVPKVLASSAAFTNAMIRYAQLLHEAQAVVPASHPQHAQIMAVTKQLMEYEMEWAAAQRAGTPTFAQLRRQVQDEVTRLTFQRASTGFSLVLADARGHQAPVPDTDRPAKTRKMGAASGPQKLGGK